jgi:hypothetical protein
MNFHTRWVQNFKEWIRDLIHGRIYCWECVVMPDNAPRPKIEKRLSKKPKISNLALGQYVFRVHIFDNTGDHAYSDCNIQFGKL